MLKDSKVAKRGTGKLGLVGRARAEAEHLVKDARRVGMGVQKRAERAVHDIEHSAEKLLGELETRLVKAIAPVLKRTFATRRELRDLNGAVAALTRKLDDLARRSA